MEQAVSLSNPMFEALNLSKSYNGTVALDQLNLTIQAGEIFCPLGANGAGKTATITLRARQSRDRCATHARLELPTRRM